LTVPNDEVKWGLVESLLPAYAPGYSELHLVGCAFDSDTHLLSDWAVM
jgi:hypothetical protein